MHHGRMRKERLWPSSFTRRATSIRRDGRDSSYYLRCEHSSATWSEDHPGEKLSAEFDEAMTKLLAPYARDGMLRFAVRTRIEWGHLRASEES